MVKISKMQANGGKVTLKKVVVGVIVGLKSKYGKIIFGVVHSEL